MLHIRGSLSCGLKQGSLTDMLLVLLQHAAAKP
jgi:hypothetical protein